MSGMRRRTLLSAAPVGAALAATRVGHAQSNETIKIGMICSLSGGLAFFQAIRVGAEIALDRINKDGGLLGGRKLELVVRDDRGSPTEAVAALREFAGQGINLNFGTPLTPAALAVYPVVPTVNAVHIVSGSSNLAYSHELFNKNSFTIIENDFINRRLFGQLLANVAPTVTKWGAIFPDIVSGHDSWKFISLGLREGHEKAGRKAEFAEPVLTKVGQPEFRTQVARLMSQPIEGVFNQLFGPDENSFYQQGIALGLFKQIKINADVSNGPDIGRALRNTTPENTWCYVHFWADGNKNPIADELRTEYLKRTNEAFTSPYSFPGNTAIFAYANAIKKAGSTSTEAVAGALEGLQYQSAKGDSTFRKEDHQGLAKLNFVRLGPTADGWEVKEFRDVVSAPFANKPEPGVKFSL